MSHAVSNSKLSQGCSKLSRSCPQVVSSLPQSCQKVVKFSQSLNIVPKLFCCKWGVWGIARKHSRLVKNIVIEDGIVCLNILSLLMTSVIWKKVIGVCWISCRSWWLLAPDGANNHKRSLIFLIRHKSFMKSSCQKLNWYWLYRIHQVSLSWLQVVSE